MKKFNYQPAILLVLLIALSSVLFSFSLKTLSPVANNFGGEGFEVYLNNKLVLQQFGDKMSSVKTLQLDQTASNGQMEIRYFHCGRPGKSRVVTIKDEQNVVLKEWRFGDGKKASKVCCNIKDILALPKIKAGRQVQLYYASSELPKGRMLAILTSANKSVAQP